jgi:hypothetical protein
MAVGLGIKPALLSLAMVLTYSIVLGSVYVTLDKWIAVNRYEPKSLK